MMEFSVYIMVKKYFFRRLIVTTAAVACLCVPAFAVENTGDYDPSDMWAATHPITDISPYDVSEDIDGDVWYKTANEAFAEYLQQESEPKIPPAGILGTINVDGVNLWKDASDSAELLGTISCGQKITVLERDGEWCKVSCNGSVGYVKSSRISSCGLPLDCTTGKVVGIGTLRSIPSDDGTLVTNIYEGTELNLLSLENGWYSATCGTASGYIRMENISADSDADVSLITPKAESKTEVAGTEQSSAETGLGDRIVAEAEKYMGTRYVYGGSSPSGFDCSGFTQYVYKQLGYSIPHSASSQWTSLETTVSRDDLRPGDLVFFCDPSRSEGKACSHVGIYIGDGEFIHAASGSSSGKKVRVSSLSESYYSGYYKGAKRVA